MPCYDGRDMWDRQLAAGQAAVAEAALCAVLKALNKSGIMGAITPAGAIAVSSNDGRIVFHADRVEDAILAAAAPEMRDLLARFEAGKIHWKDARDEARALLAKIEGEG